MKYMTDPQAWFVTFCNVFFIFGGGAGCNCYYRSSQTGFRVLHMLFAASGHAAVGTCGIKQTKCIKQVPLSFQNSGIENISNGDIPKIYGMSSPIAA